MAKIRTEKQLRKDFDSTVAGNLALWSGEFHPDPRYEELIRKIDWYYMCTPTEMSNRDALPYSRELHKFVRDCGYTNKEFSRAKRDYFNMRKLPDVPLK